MYNVTQKNNNTLQLTKRNFFKSILTHLTRILCLENGCTMSKLQGHRNIQKNNDTLHSIKSFDMVIMHKIY